MNYDWKKREIGFVGMDVLYYLMVGFFFSCFAYCKWTLLEGIWLSTSSMDSRD